MTFHYNKRYGFGTSLLICFILIAALFIAMPSVTLAQQTGGAAAATSVSPTQCGISVTNMGAIFNPICWGRVIGSFVGGFLVSIAGWFLTIAGVLFNWALNITVVQFGQFITPLIPSITSAWTAFRDISNIIIIGMFTFIAISIILGLKEFGQKKLIAHVLIIAVLINFSLLFSKMLIDASNFVSTQFYNAALNQSAGGAASSNSQLGIGNCPTGTANSQCYGIAGAFMDYAGVSGFGDTAQAVRNLADTLDDGNVALLHAIFIAILFIGAALVLFYGAFLLISRGILFIFLMAVSSLAFASYLVPAWDKSNYGFNAWKDSILKNALLAPLMIMFLWMTLNVANAMKAGANGGTLGDLIANPTKNLDINALFSYVVIMGMLFMSFKLSSSLAGKIGGFSFASMIPGTVLGLGGLATNRLTRGTVGYGASLAVEALKKKKYGYRDKATGEWKPGKEGKFGLGSLGLQTLDKLQTAKVNPFQAKTFGVGNKLASALSVPKVLTGKNVGGSFDDEMKRKAKAADDLARRIGPNDEQRKEAANADVRTAQEQRAQHRRTETANQERSRELVAAITAKERPLAVAKARADQGTEREQAEKEFTQKVEQAPEREQLEKELAQAVAQNTDAQKHPQYAEYTEAKKGLETIDTEHAKQQDARKATEAAWQAAIPAASPEEKTKLVEQVKMSSQGQRESEMRHQKERIKKADEFTKLAKAVTGGDANVARLAQVVTEGNTAVQQTVERVQKLDDEAGHTADAELASNPEFAEAAKELNEATENLNRIAIEGRRAETSKDAERRRDIAFRKSLLWDKRASSKVEGEMKAHERRQLVADIKAILPREEGGSAPAAPAAPVTPPQGRAGH